MMPRAKESLRIDVAQSTTEDARTITVTITARARDFLLPDLLAKRGAITPFESILRQSVRDTIVEYLAGTEELIAGIAGGEKPVDRSAQHAPSPNGAGSAGKKSYGLTSEEPAITPSIDPI